jgi:hypothetical protein
VPQDALDDRQVHLVRGEERRERMTQVVPPKPAPLFGWNDAGLRGSGAKMILAGGYSRTGHLAFGP